MSVLARFSPPSMTAEKYDELVSLLYSKGVHPAEGLELEVCYGSGDQMKVSVLFDTIEQLEAFGNKIKPLFEEIGFDPGEPEIVECAQSHPARCIKNLISYLLSKIISIQ